MNPVVNPALKRAVEERRRELRLELSDVVERSGLTRQGIANVRRGEMRDYQESTIFGIAKALEWDVDWFERVKAGMKPRVMNGPTADELSRLRLEVNALRRAVRELQEQAVFVVRQLDATPPGGVDVEVPPSSN